MGPKKAAQREPEEDEAVIMERMNKVLQDDDEHAA